MSDWTFIQWLTFVTLLLLPLRQEHHLVEERVVENAHGLGAVEKLGVAVLVVPAEAGGQAGRNVSILQFVVERLVLAPWNTERHVGSDPPHAAMWESLLICVSVWSVTLHHCTILKNVSSLEALFRKSVEKHMFEAEQNIFIQK